MKARFIISMVLICLGLVAAILPQKKNSSVELNALELLNEIQLQNHFISIDEMANALINKDPEYQLIDLRTEDEYKLYNLPGSINIPFAKLFDEEWSPYIDQIARKNVFYSNGTTLSGEAWLLTKQRGFKNNYILKGGLNEWYATIIEPEVPASTESVEELNKYQARLGAKQYFTGAGAEVNTDAAVGTIKLVPRKKKKMVAGGCS